MENFKFMSFLLNRFVPRFLRFSVLCHLIFFHSLVFGQDYIIRQDIQGSTNQPERQLQGQLLQTADGYTPITGVTPTITIRIPGATSFSAAVNAGVDVGTGNYTFAVAPTEWENLGYGAFQITGTGARPKLYTYRVVESGSLFREGTSLNKYPNNYSVDWALTAVTNTQNTTATFDGYTIADTLTGNGASAKHKAGITLVKPDGAGMIMITAEVKSGTLNNAWIGDDNYGAGVDIDTSTGVATPTTSGYLRGWKVSKLASSWWRVSVVVSTGQTDSTANSPTIALGNGTAGTAVPTFTTSGTMIFARAFVVKTDDVSPEYLSGILPNVASAANASTVTLDANASTSSSPYVGREVCFPVGYTATIYWKDTVFCSCVATYNGGTKTITLTDSLPIVLNNTYKYKFGGLCLKNVNATVTSMTTDSISAAAVSAAAAAKIGATVPTNINMGG